MDNPGVAPSPILLNPLLRNTRADLFGFAEAGGPRLLPWVDLVRDEQPG
jgi:hypothetical protein